MPEGYQRKIERFLYNVFPAIRGTGGWITYIADDYREIRVKLPLSWRTRNKVGTIFGGSMYSAVDPFYMIMLMKILGDEYVVWDRSAKIRFKKPGRETLYAEFHISQEESDEIVEILETRKSTNRDYVIELKNADGEVHAIVEKEIYVSRKRRPATVSVNEPALSTE
ncbi:MAG: DUF4442 domain-containing protein [Pyrinomonadaceae bacterium]|nr:DUF4442 domain-containing protein [Pyrinomonadaceae bacterium]